MPRFVFPLQALLTHREQIEKDKQRAVAVIQQQMQTIRLSIQETETRIVAEDHTLGARELTGALDMQYIAHEKRFVGNLRLKIMLALQKLAGLEKALAGARAELLAAARDRKVIEKLREKQWERWKAEEDRKENAVLDDIGMQIAIRRPMEADSPA